MKPLIEELGSYEAIVDKFASDIKKNISSLDVEDFKKWMMLHKKYSESNYKTGMFFDRRLYYYCYQIYKKMKSGENQHHMILVSGKIGKGKSVLGCQIAALIDPSLNMERICYVPPHLFRRFAKSNPSEANVIDEGGNFFKAKNTMTKIGKDIGQAFQLIRDLQQILIICYDEPEKLDKDIIDKFDGIFIKRFDPSESGDRRYASYMAFNNKACDKIKPLLKKRIPITDEKILENRTWIGRNTKEMPIVNDFNESTYRNEKRKYLRDHMMLLANKYKEEYQEIDKPPVSEPKKLQPGMSIPKWAKLKGISYNTARRWIKKGLVKYERIGSRVIVTE